VDAYLWQAGLRNYLKEVYAIEILHIRTLSPNYYRITTNHFVYSNWREEMNLLCIPANILVEWEFVNALPEGPENNKELDYE